MKYVQNGEDDCGEYPVSRQQLISLHEAADTVLKAKDAGEDLAERILPTQAGFFFGGTDYDKYYFSDLKETRTKLEGILADESLEQAFYQSSW